MRSPWFTFQPPVAVERAEREARASLYPTRERDVIGAPRSAPVTAPSSTQEGRTPPAADGRTPAPTETPRS